jgi:prevent-host-death family protein
MGSYNVHEAKSNLSRLLQKTAAGEQVIIMRDGKRVAELIPYRRPRRFCGGAAFVRIAAGNAGGQRGFAVGDRDQVRRGRSPHRRPRSFLAGLAGGARVLPVDAVHAYAVCGIPPVHRDPFDRLLVSQAIAEGLPLLTNDELIAQYPVRCVW